jgi:small-conductance mechanosensitive channel
MSTPAPTPLAELLDAIADGMSRPRHASEALVIVLALVCGLLFARLLANLLAARRKPAAGVAPPIGAVRRLLYPLLTLLFLWAGELALRLAHVVTSAADARLLRLAASLVATLAVVRVLLALLRRVFRSRPWMVGFERLIGVLALLVAGLYLTGALGDVVDWLDSTPIPLGANAHVTLWSVLLGSATTLVALLAAMWLGSLFDERLAAQQGLDPNLRTVLGRVVRALLLVFAVLLALGLSGIDLTVLSVFGGALGVGLGLGLQRIASNYVSGFILLLDRSLRIGDVITVDKYTGQVTQISTRYTVLRSSDGTDAVIPNEMLVSSPVVNATLGDPRVVLALLVTVGPQVDLDLALRLLCEAAATPARVLKAPAPLALLREFQGGNLVLECDFWIADPQNGRQNVISEVAIAVYRQLGAHGIALASPRSEAVTTATAAVPARGPAGAERSA